MFGAAADLWSVGMTCAEMALGKPPWGTPAHALYKLCMTADAPELPPGLSAACRAFLLQCLDRDPARRTTAAALLGHGFFAAGAEADAPAAGAPGSPGPLEASQAAEGAGADRGSRAAEGEPAAAATAAAGGSGGSSLSLFGRPFALPPLAPPCLDDSEETANEIGDLDESVTPTWQREAAEARRRTDI